MPLPIDELHECLKTRHDEIAIAEHGFRAGPRVRNVIESLNRISNNVSDVLMVENLQLPANKVRLLGYQKQVVQEFDL